MGLLCVSEDHTCFAALKHPIAALLATTGGVAAAR